MNLGSKNYWCELLRSTEAVFTDEQLGYRIKDTLYLSPIGVLHLASLGGEEPKAWDGVSLAGYNGDLWALTPESLKRCKFKSTSEELWDSWDRLHHEAKRTFQRCWNPKTLQLEGATAEELSVFYARYSFTGFADWLANNYERL